MASPEKLFSPPRRPRPQQTATDFGAGKSPLAHAEKHAAHADVSVLPDAPHHGAGARDATALLEMESAFKMRLWDEESATHCMVVQMPAPHRWKEHHPTVMAIPPLVFQALSRAKATCARLLTDLASQKRTHARELQVRDLAISSLRGELLLDRAERISLERSMVTIQHDERLKSFSETLHAVAAGSDACPPTDDSDAPNASGVLDGLSSVDSLSSTDDER